jgi:probable F420-dependent oxidoreductase
MNAQGQQPPVGTFGVWVRGKDITAEGVAQLEALGFGAVWLGGSPDDSLSQAEELLDATTTLTVATGIVNIWNTDPRVLAERYHRVVERHPGRLILGIGAGHPETTGASAAKPFGAVVDYLDTLDDNRVPRRDMALAALGPRMLKLAAERTAGAHPYLVTPEHTALARELVGPEALLAPEQRVVLRADPAEARAIGRPSVASPYLGLVNYRNNLERLGFSQTDLSGEGSDHLIDELVVSGDDAAIAGRLRSHLEAGADHVAIQLVSGPDDDPAAGYAELARILGLE